MQPTPFGSGGSLGGTARRFTSLMFALLAIALSAVGLSAQQTGRIVGRVTTAESGAPISEAQVFIPGTGIGGLTRQNGTFVILEAPAGTHELRVEHLGGRLEPLDGPRLPPPELEEVLVGLALQRGEAAGIEVRTGGEGGGRWEAPVLVEQRVQRGGRRVRAHAVGGTTGRGRGW